MHEQEYNPKKSAFQSIPYGFYKHLAIVLAAADCSIGVISLVGGFLGYQQFNRIQADWVNIKANTALCLALAGMAIIVHLKNTRANRVLNGAVSAAGVLIIAVGALTLIQYLASIDLHIDELLFKQPTNYLDREHPGRPSPVSAVAFVFAGLAVLSLGRRHDSNWRTLGVCSNILLGVIGFLCLSGHMLNLSAFYKANQVTAVSFQSAIAFVLMAFAILFSASENTLRIGSWRLVFGLSALVISLIVTGAGLITYDLMQHTTELRHWVIHTEEVVIELQALATEINATESEQGSYLLTGKQQYLDNYVSQASLLSSHLEKIKKMVSDNPLQSQRTQSLRLKVITELSLLAQSAELQKKLGVQNSLSSSSKNIELTRRYEINTAINELMIEERKLLKRRNDKMVQTTNDISSRFACLGIVALINILLAVYVIYQTLLRQERERLGQRIIYKVSKVLSTELSLDAAISQCLSLLCEQLNRKVGVFWHLPENSDVLHCFSFYSSEPVPNFEAASRSTTFNCGIGLPGSVWRNHVTEWIEDVVVDDNFPRAPFADKDNIHAAIAFPIYVGNAFFGVFELFSDKALKLDKNLLPVLEIASVDIAQLIDRKLSAEKISTQARLDTFAAEIIELLSQTKELSATLALCTESMIKHLDAELVKIWTIDESKTCLELSSAGGSQSQIESMGDKIALDNSHLGKIVCAGVPFITYDKSSLAGLDSIEGFASLHAYPLELGAEILGLLVITFKTKQSKEAINLLERISAALSIGIKRKTMETALQRSERKFKAIFDHTFEFIWLLSPAGVLLECNKTALDFAGIDRAKVIGLPLYKTTWWEHSDKLRDQLKQALDDARQGTFVRFESNQVAANGSSLFVDFSLKPVLDDNNGVVMLIAEGRDISEKKEAEKRVSEFYSTVSHELRTPLTSIRGAFGLLEGGKAGELSSKAQRLVQMGRSESERLVRLINDILDIRKIEAGKLELKCELIDPALLIDKTLEALAAFAAEAHVSLRRELNGEVKINVDKDRFTQVITNLVSNAVKFSPEGTEVLVATSRRSNALRISVSDSGPGIKKEDMRKLFHMFEQLDSSDTRMKGGTGLGLAISKAIVEEHGGKIGVESAYGVGSTFWIELPVVTESLPEPVQTSAPAQRGLLNVLLVEDEDGIATVISMALMHQNIEVLRCSTIAEAEKQLAANHFDAIILDIHLPDGSGTQIMDKLQQNINASPVPIVVVSASQQDNYSYPLLIDWISKPFEEKRLLSAVELAMRRRAAGPARVLIVEDDDSTRQIIKDYVLSIKAEIQCFEASDGKEAIELTREHDPDLIILDLGLPHTDGFEVVTVLKHEKASKTPLLVYSARDLSTEEKNRLSLGLTTHFTKSRTSESEFVKGVIELLNGTISHPNEFQANALKSRTDTV